MSDPDARARDFGKEVTVGIRNGGGERKAGDRRVRVGLIGCGAGHAHSAHLHPLVALASVELVALCDLNETALKQEIEKFGGGRRESSEPQETRSVPRGYTDFRQMLSREELDAVFVIIRPSRLKDVVIPCFERGLHVSVEKSPGISSEETLAMLQAAEANGCLNIVGFNRRFSPAVTHTMKLLGETSAPQRIVGRFYRTYGETLTGEHAGIHGIDMMRRLGGEAAAISSWSFPRGQSVRKGIDVVLEYRDGSTGLYSEMHASGLTEEVYEIHREGVSALIDYQRGRTEIRRTGEAEPVVLEASTLAGSSDPAKTHGSFYETADFIDCVREGRKPFPDLRDSLETMRLNERIFQGLRA